MDKVSMIVPVYNVERYLRRCLDSIMGQTYKNIEVIVIDDGSSDSSGVICDEYKSDIRFHIIHQKNKGISETRNRALKLISGDYILFVDSDDYIEKYLVENVLKSMKDNKVDVVIFSNYEVSPTGIKKFTNEFEKEHIDISQLDTNEIYRLVMMDKILNVMWNKMYKSSLWDGMEFPVGYNYEDLFIQPSLLMKAKKMVYIHQYLYYNNRVNPNSITSNRNDFNSRNRYGKFKAYYEHERVANLIQDKDIEEWASYQTLHEAIKTIYIDYNSADKLTGEEKEEIYSYLVKEKGFEGKYKLSKKYELLKWSAIHFPVLCQIYSKIRFLQERMRNKR